MCYGFFFSWIFIFFSVFLIYIFVAKIFNLYINGFVTLMKRLFAYKTHSAFIIGWIWMLLLLSIWKSIVEDDDGWKLLMLHIFFFDNASEDGATLVSTFFGSVMGVNDSSPLESFSISAPNWWRAVMVDGVGSGMLCCWPGTTKNREFDKFIESIE